MSRSLIALFDDFFYSAFNNWNHLHHVCSIFLNSLIYILKKLWNYIFIYIHAWTCIIKKSNSWKWIHENELSHKIMWTPHKPTDSVKIYESYMQNTWNDDNYIPTSLIILGSICECKLCIWFLDCRCVGVPLHRWSWCTDWNIWRSTLRTKLASSCRNTWN